MNKNLDDFCRKLLRNLDDESSENGLDSESIAWEFVRSSASRPVPRWRS